MSVLSMPCLPDCAVCGGQVVVDTDLDGGVEVCTGCGIAQPVPGVWDRAEIRRRVRKVAGRVPLLSPSCTGRRHHLCKVASCQCTCPHEARQP